MRANCNEVFLVKHNFSLWAKILLWFTDCHSWKEVSREIWLGGEVSIEQVCQVCGSKGYTGYPGGP